MSYYKKKQKAASGTKITRSVESGGEAGASPVGGEDVAFTGCREGGETFLLRLCACPWGQARSGTRTTPTWQGDACSHVGWMSRDKARRHGAPAPCQSPPRHGVGEAHGKGILGNWRLSCPGEQTAFCRKKSVMPRERQRKSGWTWA